MHIDERKLAKSVALNCQDVMRQLCNNLAQYFGIDHFSYIKCFDDGTHLMLDTHNEWTQVFYQNSYKEYNIFIKNLILILQGFIYGLRYKINQVSLLLKSIRALAMGLY